MAKDRAKACGKVRAELVKVKGLGPAEDRARVEDKAPAEDKAPVEGKEPGKDKEPAAGLSARNIRAC